jgi:hypothetical protein
VVRWRIRARLDWKETEADVGEEESRKSQSNGNYLCGKIRRSMEKLLEKCKMVPTKD